MTLNSGALWVAGDRRACGASLIALPAVCVTTPSRLEIPMTSIRRHKNSFFFSLSLCETAAASRHLMVDDTKQNAGRSHASARPEPLGHAVGLGAFVAPRDADASLGGRRTLRHAHTHTSRRCPWTCAAGPADASLRVRGVVLPHFLQALDHD